MSDRDRARTPDRDWAALHERELHELDGAASPEDQVTASEQEAEPESPPPSSQSTPGLRWSYQAPARERIGLALSGGGIRSATFNLGLLQKLDELGALRSLDYLSTVSGGGYIGAFWSAWKARPGTGDRTFPRWARGEAEPPEVRHLREYSNFLRPRAQLLSSETGAMASGIVGALLPSITAALSVLALILASWLGLAFLVLRAPADATFPWPAAPPLALAGITLAVHALFEGIWRIHHGRRSTTSPSPGTEDGGAGEEETEASGDDEPGPARRNDRATGTLVVSALASALLAAGAWALLWPVAPSPFAMLLRPARLSEASVAAGTSLLPSGAWLVAILVLVLVRLASSRWVRSWRGRSRKAALDRTLSRVILCALAWLVFGLVWFLGQVIAAEGLGWIAALAGGGGAGGGLFAWARRFLGTQPNKPSGGKVSLLAGPWLLSLLAYLVLAAIGVAVAALLVSLESAGFRWTVVAAGGVFLATAIAFEPQENGFHAFYRQRLVRAFLGASNRTAAPGATPEQEQDDLALEDLPSRPLHLICCAANDLSADPLGTLHRGAVSAVLSRQGLQVDGAWHAWADDDRRTGTPGRPTLGSAITASAAAFNSQMGSKSVRLGPAATFLLGALSLRLGLWVENPAAPRSGLAALWTKLQRCCPGLLFFRELAGASRARSTWIHLSDGAHFENLALYELVRRHCRCILLSDCGADPDVAFDDFGNAVRRIREDFGVEIEIDLAPLRPGEDGIAAQPMVAGTVRYPTGDLGVLLYVKPTLVGDEPADVAQYARRNDRFPHETTLDQFYDEAQWEAYRRLGEHVADRALGTLAARLRDRDQAPPSPDDGLDRDELVRLFLHARYTWPPDGSDDPTVTESVERDWTRLEARLERPSAAALRRQLLPDGKAPAKPTEKDLARALPLLREALRLMETTILDTGMAATPYAPSHPRYMGWLNRFGRWTSAPLFHAWWPWLAPIHSQPVREFLEATFGLPSAAHPESVVRELTRTRRKGFAWTRWNASRSTTTSRGRTDGDPTLFGLFVPMGAAPGGELLAGIAAIRLQDEPGGAVASWSQEDLFVPPGLWGVGLGERFLSALLDALEDRDVTEVRVTSEDRATMAWEALYTGAGFRRQGLDLLIDLPRPRR